MDDEMYEVIAEYLERLGVKGLRQAHDPKRINKSAITRYLVTEKYEEALAHAPAPKGTIKRTGPSQKAPTSKRRK
ncbi:MAG: hypothetical protein K8L99_03650 [Anaerolineae bacterium]|nr:hypothetical protein [Anaerolineae bacterium]